MFLEIIILWITLGIGAYLFSVFDLWKLFTNREEGGYVYEEDYKPPVRPTTAATEVKATIKPSGRPTYWYPAPDAGKILNSSALNLQLNEWICGQIGDVISTPVRQLYNHPEYESAFDKYHSKLSAAILDQNSYSEFSIQSLAELKELIWEIRLAMEDLSNFPDECICDWNDGGSSSFPVRVVPSYEDLMSTAILNRIILSSQESKRSETDSPNPSSRVEPLGASVSPNSMRRDSSESNDGVEGWVEMTARRASDDNISDSDPDRSNDQIIIEEHIEEEIIIKSYNNDNAVAPAAAADGYDEDADESQASGTYNEDGSWEENWLFKKKKGKHPGVNQKDAVSMFIPNPVQEPTTDDDENENDEEGEAEEEEGPGEIELISPKIITIDVDIHTTSNPDDIVIEQIEKVGDANESSLDSNTEAQKETSQSLIEANETIEIPQELTPSISPVNEPEFVAERKPTVAMRIAEREKEKWNNPVQLPNNPYTPENLIKRISNNSFLRYNNSSSDSSMATTTRVDGDKDVTKKVNETPVSAPAASTESGSSAGVSVEKIKRDFESTSTNSTNLAPSPVPRSRSRTPEKMDEVNSHSVSSSVTPVSVTSDPDLNEIKLPSVRDLRLRFSAPVKQEEQPKVIKSPKRATSLAVPGLKERESASRSMSPEDMSDPTSVPFEFVDMPSTPVDPSPEPKPDSEPSLKTDQLISKNSDENTDPPIKSKPKPEPELESEPQPVPIATLAAEESSSISPNVTNVEDQSDSASKDEEADEPRPLSNARALIEKLEKLNKAAEPQPLPPSAYSRQKSVESPKTAMEFFASQEIRKVTPLEPDEDLRKLRRSILRESRGSKGASMNFDE